MKRHLAYVCSPIRFNNELQTKQDMKKAGEYCRLLYEAGYTPIAPQLFLPYYLDGQIIKERDDIKKMSLILLRRCHVLVLCGSEANCGMLELVQAAQTYHITATTLEGLLSVQQLTSHRQDSTDGKNPPTK